ncbi:GrdX protein [Tissierella creatinini]|nr:GrdX protein [Tissierella creatinini]TJX67379.1 GrdX protein [Soehngenia saccharolytica]
MKKVLVTNNVLVYEKYKDKQEVEYLEGQKYLDVLEYVRTKLHEGHKLLSHPLSGSIKPNETPYKSIIISKDIYKADLDIQGTMIIEDSIATAKKFQEIKTTPQYRESILDDFRVIDLSLMENVIDKLGHM